MTASRKQLSWEGEKHHRVRDGGKHWGGKGEGRYQEDKKVTWEKKGGGGSSAAERSGVIKETGGVHQGT